MVAVAMLMIVVMVPVPMTVGMGMRMAVIVGMIVVPAEQMKVVGLTGKPPHQKPEPNPNHQ
jgi:hypothetical protein